jgi:hypothetical protein
MRTTVAIDDHILAAARREARQRDLTLGQLLEEALRHELARTPAARERPPIPVFRGGRGLRPGIDATSTRALLEALDDGVAVDRLR